MSVKAITTVSTSPLRISSLSRSMSSSRGLRSGRLIGVLSSSTLVGMRAERASTNGPCSCEQATQQGGGVVAVALHHPAALGGLALEDGVEDGAVLTRRVVDVDVEHGYGAEHVVQVGLHGGDRPDGEGGLGDRGDGEVEARVRLAVLRRVGG